MKHYNILSDTDFEITSINLNFRSRVSILVLAVLVAILIHGTKQMKMILNLSIFL
jgi:hypothetical protein